MLIDTNVLSELRLLASDRIAPAVRAWAETLTATTLYISAMSVLEIEAGILRRRRKDTVHAAILQHWLDTQILQDFAGRILPVDVSVARACAHLHLGRTRPYVDSLIAAAALAHDLPLATRNTRDFIDTGVRLVDPWAYRVGTGSAPE